MYSYISFRYTTLIRHFYALFMLTSVATIVSIQHYIIDYILYDILFIPMTYLFYHWNSVSPAPLHPFCPSPHPHPDNNQVCSLYL